MISNIRGEKKKINGRSLIVTPAGKKYWISFDDDELDRVEELNRMAQNYWEDYCDANWLNYKEGDFYCPERKIKYFLDGCGSYLLDRRLKDSGVLSRYKEKQAEEFEVLMPPEDMDDAAEENWYRHEYTPETEKMKDRPCTPTKFDRMRKAFPDGLLESARVDTMGVFEYRGQAYQISDEATEYRVTLTRVGDLHDSDRVYCYTPRGESMVVFYGYESLEPLGELVSEIQTGA